MKTPLISVIVPTYNRRNFLPRTLKSILDGSYNRTEVVVVNDGGVDVSDIINGFNDNRIKYIVNEKNIGLAATRNVALRNVTGDYICLLDDDDIHLNFTLEFRIYMMRLLGADVVYTRALQNILKPVDETYVLEGSVLYWDSPFTPDLILVQNIAPCCCPLFSTKVWKESSAWFDESLTTGEDHDFWINLSRNNRFHELKLVDCECSYTLDKKQMTGTLDFSKNWVKIFKKWRHTAKDVNWVSERQNAILNKAGIKPEEYGL